MAPGRAGADGRAEPAIDLVAVTPAPAHERLLEAFHGGIYLDAFAAQREPLDVWRRALRGELPYRQTIRLALDGDRIAGGIAYELYPESRCGLVTYNVVAPEARGGGLGRRLLEGATAELYAAGARAVLGEVNDPRRPRAPHEESADAAWARLERNQRWGARVLAARYVQPALGPGLLRDRGLVLIALPGTAPLPAEFDGAIPRAFVEELYAITEGGPPDAEIAFPDRVPLALLRRAWPGAPRTQPRAPRLRAPAGR
jgi:GNAT superfamily N-acetyltransferase